MDPVACVARILSLIADHEGEEAVEACRDLRGWIARGGFRPHGWTAEQCAAFLTMAWATAEAI